MGFLDGAVSALNQYLPEPYRIPDDRRQWWALQACAHAALVLVFCTLVLCIAAWDPETDVHVDGEFILESLDILLPGLFLIQVYFVPMYSRYLGGRDPLWKFFAGPAAVTVIGLLSYPVYRYFLAAVWAELMLLFALAVSTLLLAGAVAMHLIFKCWLALNRPKSDLLPPPAGRL